MKRLQSLSYKTLFAILFFSLAGIVFFLKIGGKTQKVSAAWWDEMWHYRKAISITNSSGSNLTDFQVSISIGTSALIASGKMQTDCDDIRITDINGNLLPYWIEENNPGCNSPNGDTKVWVKASSLPTSGATVYIYYGNSTADNNENGDNVFEFFDDFNGTSIDTNKWQMLKTDNTDASSYWSQTAGSLQVNPVLSGIATITSKNFTIQNGVIETRYIGTTASSDPDNDMLFIWRWQDYRNFYFFHHDYANPANTTCANLPADNVNISKLINGTESCLTWIAAPSSDEYPNWYNAIIKFNDNNYSVNYSKYPSNWYDVIDTSITSAGRVGFGKTHNEEHPKWDYIFVHKYASTQPTTSNQSEESGGGPIAYWKFDEGVGTTAYDSSSNQNNGVISGATWQTEDMCISGKCLNFNNANSILITDNLKLKPNNVTVSVWVNPKTQNGNHKGIVSKGDNGVGYEIRTTAYTSNTTTFQFRLNGDSGSPSVITVDNNKWSYLVGTYDGSSTKFYLNGVLKSQLNYSTPISYSPTYNVTIGALTYTGGLFFNGLIDEPKIYPYARTADQIKQDYNSRGSASSQGSSVNLGSNKNSNSLSDGLVGYWKMDEGVGTNITDSSGNNNTGTFGTGTSAPTWTSGKFGIGTSFDGNDYINAGTSSIFNLNNQFSFETWINVSSLTPTWQFIMGKSSYWGVNDAGLHIKKTGLEFFVDNCRDSDYFTITTNKWYHIVGVYNGTNRQLYVDGKLEKNSSCTGKTLNNAYNFSIGADNEFTYNYSGLMDDVRLYNRALSPAEVSDLYNYAPGPIAYYDFNENIGTQVKDISNNNRNMSFNNTPQWTSGKYGSALHFNDNDYTSSDWTDFSLINQTVEFWINPDKIDTLYHDLVGTSNNGESNRFHLNKTNNSIIWWNILGLGSSVLDSNYVPPINQWTHVSGTYDGTTAKIFINGIFKNSMIIPYTNYISAGIWVSGITEKFNGKIDDVKIYNYARTQKQIIEDMNAGKPAASAKSMIAHYKFDEGSGTTANNSGNAGSALNGTFGTGSSAPTWNNDGKSQKALSFDGSSDYVSIPDTNNILDMSNMTITGWINTNDSLSGHHTIASRYGESFLINYYNNVFETYFYTSGGTCHVNGGSFSNYLNKWHYFAASYDGQNSKIYLDGNLINSISTCSGPINASSQNLYIGSRSPASAFLNAKIDEVKIYNYALTDEEVKQDYNAGSAIQFGTTTQNIGGTTTSLEYCIPGDTTYCAPPIAEWNFEENTGTVAKDTSGNNNNGTFGTGNSAPTWSLGKNNTGAGLNFDGNDYLSSSYSFSAGQAFTITGWAYSTETGSNYRNIFDTVSVKPMIWWDTTGKIEFDAGQARSSLVYRNKWVFIALSKPPGNTAATYYVDGVAIGTGSTYSIPAITPTWFNRGGSQAWLGKADNIRIYNYARTPAQIAYDYNRGAPIGWWKLDECQGSTAFDSSGLGNTGVISIGQSGTQTTLGTCQIGTSAAWTAGASGHTNSSLNFDGTDDYVSIPNNSTLNITGEMSISLWIKPESNSSCDGLVDKSSGGGAQNAPYSLWRCDQKFNFYRGNGSTYNTLITLNNYPSGKWYHITIVSNDLKNKIYLNGIEENSTNKTLTYIGNSNPLIIGAMPNNQFPGQIDDVRIYNYALTSEQVKQVYNGGAVNFQ